MIPQRISIENFLSFGPETVFVFDENEPLWILSGPNGVGKSTVFDAITYALFGCHRGGKQEHEHLIRHGSNYFRVVFEFIYDGERYRISRSRSRKPKRSVQTVEQWNSSQEEWAPINCDDSPKGLNAWTVQTIGLDYTAFTSSVLLKQGEAEAFIKSEAVPRLELLKKIVQMEPFEQLSFRVHEATKERKRKQDELQMQFSSLAAVTAEELAAADEQVSEMAKAKETASETYQAALKLISQGTEHRKATARCQELTKILQAAEARAARAETIRAGYHRWNDLNKVVPILEKLEPLPARVKHQEERVADCQGKEEIAHKLYQASERGVEDLENQRASVEQARNETKERLGKLEQQQKETFTQLKHVKELDEAEMKLAQFPKTLENDLAQVAEQAEKLAKTIAQVDKQAFSLGEQADGLRKQLRDFSNVKTGVPCSRCGQEVSKKHALEEAKRLEGIIKETETQLAALKKEQDEPEAAAVKLKKQKSKLEGLVQEKNTAKTMVEALQLTLRNQNITATLPELEKKQKELERELPAAKSQATEAGKRYETHLTSFKQMVAERKTVRIEWEQAQQKTASASTELDKLRFEQVTYLDQLPEAWKARHPIDRTGLMGLQEEFKALITQNIVADHDQLTRDVGEVTARRDEYERQQALLQELPDEAKLSEAELQQRLQAAKAGQTAAEQLSQAAVRSREDRQRRQADHARHAASLKQAEESLRIQKKLDDLLGKEGLQRKLVCSAELDLAESASQTLSKLTNGELSLDLNPEAKPDEAFDLIVRQSNSSHTTSVSYLSGSQKFRVSVAIALAIGKYASGRNRPLESVIIDEGFGSLDRDGLAAMARELQSLQHTAALKRIILVSHQEDFVENFPVGYHLTPGANGTTAKRRSR